MTRAATNTRPSHPRPVPQRVAWFEGSPLLHGDLADAVAHEERLLALHVAAAHDTWGVALGLTLVPTADRRGVVVAPGLAYTCRGDALAVPLPTPAPAFPRTAVVADLVIAPPAAPRPADGWPCERRYTCGGATPRARPALRWEAVADASRPDAVFSQALAPGVRLGDDVPLGRFTRLPDATLVGPDHTQRRVARALARPRLGTGVAPPGSVEWAATASGDVVGTVDTSAADFSATPHYLAWFTGPVAWPPGTVGPFTSLARATATALDVRLTLGGTSGEASALGVLREGATMSSVVWVGVEAALGCPPSLAPTAAAALAAPPGAFGGAP